MTGWLLILSLLILGGVLSTIGDHIGSRVGKARLTIFNLRPRRTAVLITVLTGSLISFFSFGFMLLVSRQLRVGLFELNDLQTRLKTSREALAKSRLAQAQKDSDFLKKEAELSGVLKRISAGEKELKELERNLIALRSGNVVIGSGQPLATATVKLTDPKQAKNVIDRMLQEANLEAFRRVRPGVKPNRQILLVPRKDIERLESLIKNKGTWVVNFRSASNVLLGENIVYAFPEARENKRIVRKGEVISSTVIESNEGNYQSVRNRLRLLLASALAEVQRRGSLASALRFDSLSLNKLGKSMIEAELDGLKLEAISIRDSDTADPVYIEVRPANKSLENVLN